MCAATHGTSSNAALRAQLQRKIVDVSLSIVFMKATALTVMTMMRIVMTLMHVIMLAMTMRR